MSSPELLEELMGVTLNASKASNERVFLAEMAQEVQSLTKADLERALMERLYMEQNATSGVLPNVSNSYGLDYIVSIYKRMRSRRIADEDVTRLVFNYLNLFLQNDDVMFSEPEKQESNAAVLLNRFLITNEDNVLFVSFYDLIEDYVRFLRAQEGEGYGVFLDLLKVSRNRVLFLVSQQTFRDSYNQLEVIRIMKLCNFMLSYKEISTAFVAAEGPLMKNTKLFNARTVEVLSWFGPFFKFSFHGADNPLNLNDFMGEMNRTQANVQSAFTSSRLFLRQLHTELHQLVLSVIKTSNDGKEFVLKWFSLALELNKNRLKMYIQDQQSVSTEGFLFNVFSVLLLLAKPIFSDMMFSKLHLINEHYPLIIGLTSSEIDETSVSSKRLQTFNDQTRIGVDSNDFKALCDKYHSENPGSAEMVNFVSEVFFLTLYAFKIVISKAFQECQNISRTISEIKKQMEEVQRKKMAEMGSSMSGFPQAALYDSVLKKIESQYDKFIALRLCYDLYLFDEEFVGDCLRFQQLVMRFLLKIVVANEMGVQQNDANFGKGKV